jgi:capsular exopolysaccharide synthesis family protein
MAIEPTAPPYEDGDRLPYRAPRRRALAEQGSGELGLPLPTDARDDEEQEFNLRDAWHVLLKRRWTVLGCTALVAAVAIIGALLQTPLYRSTATLQIESSALRIVNMEGVEAIDASGDYMSTQIELLKSRAVVLRAVRQLGLVSDEDFQNAVSRPGGIAGIVSLFRGKDAKPDAASRSLESREAEAVDRVMGNRQVQVVGYSQVAKVTFASPDPRVAERVSNGLAQAFMEANLSRREENSKYARTFLEDRLSQLKLKLEDSERALIAFAQEQRLASLDQNTSLASANLTQLNDALGTATADRIRAESVWRQAQVGGGLSSDALKSPMLDKLRETRNDLKAEYEAKRATFKADYPEMQQLARRIAEVEARIKEEAGAYATAAQAEYEAARANETLLREQVASLQSELLDLQGRSVQFNILKRESDTNRQLYDALLQRYKEIGVAGGGASNNVSMVDPALPGYRFKPDIRRSALIGLLLGLMLSFALAFLLERLDETIKTPEDIERQLRLPVLGIVPKVGEGLLEAMAEDTRSPFSEAYRSLRTGLQYATEAGAPKILLVTSAVAGEGKSTTALMLARKFAQLGVKVLLIDADLRKPSLHKRLNVNNPTGLSEYLAGETDGPEMFKPTAQANLTVVTSGATPSNPAELLSAARFRTLLTLATQNFDQVIIDGPPLLGLADVPIIANAADGTLIVIEAGHARIGVLRGAMKRLFAVRARITGALLVKYDPKAAGHGYGRGYGYGYSDYFYHYSDGSDGRRLKRL